MKIGIIGLGLMGGSWGLAQKKAKLTDTIFGYDNSIQNLQKARELGLIDQGFEEVSELLKQVDQLVLTIPVDAIEEQLPDLLDQLKDHQTIVDFGSTKSLIAAKVKDHPRRGQYLAAHPITGTEYSGPSAAFESLYEGKVMILCDQALTRPGLVEGFQRQCDQIGMKVFTQSSSEHDLHLAYVSHLSHVTSFSLSNAVLKKEKQEHQILALAGSGFESTVRLAKSSPDMWTPIFLKNRAAMLESVEAYLQEVNRFKKLLESSDQSGIRAFLEEGRAIKKILK